MIGLSDLLSSKSRTSICQVILTCAAKVSVDTVELHSMATWGRALPVGIKPQTVPIRLNCGPKLTASENLKKVGDPN